MSSRRSPAVFMGRLDNDQTQRSPVGPSSSTLSSKFVVPTPALLTHGVAKLQPRAQPESLHQLPQNGTPLGAGCAWCTDS